MKSLTTPNDALAKVMGRVPAPVSARVPLAEALGLVLAEDIHADRDYPPFDRAMMDGFGVRLADAGKSARIMGEVTPGMESGLEPWDGEAVSIMTGAACPPGVEAVVPIEEVVVEGNSVTLPTEFKPGQHIALRGSERVAGTLVLGAGTTITPLAAAGLATVGAVEPLVWCRPRVAVIATGDELVEGAEAPDALHIRDSNRPLLAALLYSLGIANPLLDHAIDQPGAVRDALERAAECEVVILTGGVSAGVHDYVYGAAVENSWEVVFHKVSQKPGKPLLFATKGNRLLFGLPGNPLAVHLCAHRYIAPAIRQMTGRLHLPTMERGRSSAALRNHGPRTVFSLMQAKREGGEWLLSPAPCRGSADVLGVVEANALVRLDPGTSIDPGASLDFEWLLGVSNN